MPAPTKATNVLSKTLRYQVIFLSALSHPQERGSSGCCPGNTKSSRVLGEQQLGTTADTLQTTLPFNRLTRDREGRQRQRRAERSLSLSLSLLALSCRLPDLIRATIIWSMNW